MGWEPGQATLRKEGGVWKQNPQMVVVPDRGSFFSLADGRKLSQYLEEHGLEEDTRPYVWNRKTKYKWKRKPKRKGGEG